MAPPPPLPSVQAARPPAPHCPAPPPPFRHQDWVRSVKELYAAEDGLPPEAAPFIKVVGSLMYDETDARKSQCCTVGPNGPVWRFMHDVCGALGHGAISDPKDQRPALAAAAVVEQGLHAFARNGGSADDARRVLSAAAAYCRERMGDLEAAVSAQRLKTGRAFAKFLGGRAPGGGGGRCAADEPGAELEDGGLLPEEEEEGGEEEAGGGEEEAGVPQQGAGADGGLHPAAGGMQRPRQAKLSGQASRALARHQQQLDDKEQSLRQAEAGLQLLDAFLASGAAWAPGSDG